MTANKFHQKASQSVIDALTPIESFIPSQWMERFVIIPRSVSHRRNGPLKLQAMFRDIVDTLHTKKYTHNRVIRSATRVGKTTCMLGIALYAAFHLGQHVLIVLHDSENARDMMDNLFAIIKASPDLRKHLSINRNDKRKEYIKLKSGIKIKAATAGSNNSFAAYTAGCCIADEIDRWPLELRGEGSPLKLLEARTATYGRDGSCWLVSTPTHDDNHLAIEYRKSRSYVWTIPCATCEQYSALTWPDIKIPQGISPADLDKTTAIEWECPRCHSRVSEKAFRAIRELGRFEDTNQENAILSEHQTAYHISGLMSLERPLNDIAREFFRARGDFMAQRSFTNAVLGETFTNGREKVSLPGLMKLVDDRFASNQVPDDTLAISYGVDVGYSSEAASFTFHVVGIALQPSRNHFVMCAKYFVGEKDLVDFVTKTTYVTLNGRKVTPSVALIDSGWGKGTQYIYDIAKRNTSFIPIKGDSGMDIISDGKSDDGLLTVKRIGKQQSLADLHSLIDNNQIHFSRTIPTEELDSHTAFFEHMRSWVYDVDRHKYVEVRDGVPDHFLDCVRYATSSFIDPMFTNQGWPLKNVRSWSEVAHIYGAGPAPTAPAPVPTSQPAPNQQIHPQNRNFRAAPGRFSRFR